MTPAQVAVDLKGFAEKTFRERDEMMSLAWHTAALHRANSKKFPSLKSMLSKPTGKAPEQPWEQQMAAFKAVLARRKR